MFVKELLPTRRSACASVSSCLLTGRGRLDGTVVLVEVDADGSDLCSDVGGAADAEDAERERASRDSRDTAAISERLGNTTSFDDCAAGAANVLVVIGD